MKKAVIILLLIPNLVFAQNILHVLKTDFQKGRLSYDEYLVNKALAIYQPEKLSPTYAALALDMPLKSGTFIISEIKLNWHKLTPESQTLLKPFIYRPNLPLSYLSPSGQFRIHYTISGVNAVSVVDSDQNDIPDYVDNAAEIFDYCHKFETDSLGYQSPPVDEGIDGGNEYDVYITNLSRGLFGQTVPDGVVSGKPDTYYSYIDIDNNYSGYRTPRLDGLRVTAAHEYFHAIHMGYKFKSDDSFWDNEVFFYEISATWMEDVIYDDVNDYYFYLPYFFDNINMPFSTYNYNYEYGNCLWNHRLEKKYGFDIIRDIWEELVNYPVLEAMDRTFRKIDTSFNNELIDYSIWNYFTGARCDSINYYPEGKNYPEVKFVLDTNFKSDTTLTGSSKQSTYSYYNFYDTEYQTSVTIIPTNIDQNSTLQPEFQIEMSRRNGYLFKPIYTGFNLRMIVDDDKKWSGNAILTEATDVTSIINFKPIEEDLLNRKSLILGFGPNPFIISNHSQFNVYYQLKKSSTVKVTIFSENGVKIRDFKYPLVGSGINSFQWDQDELGEFPGGSGVYLLLLETDYSKKIIKFAVVQ